MITPILKYAIDNSNGKLVFIDFVPNGLSCNCVCPKCSGQMIAIQGKSENHREWHFRHSIDSDCTGGPETILHKLAKQIIADNNQIIIPSGTLNYSQVRQEEKFESIIPDVILFVDGHKVFIEIEVTNPVDRVKELFYKKGQYKSIKINLTNISYYTNPIELEELVLRNTTNKHVIFWETFVDKILNFCGDHPGWTLFIGLIIWQVCRAPKKHN
jgi:hypothetical protein